MTGAVVAAVLAFAAGTVGGHAQAQKKVQDQEVVFASRDAALEQGVNAFRGGYLEIAMPALRFAAKHGSFRAQFLLATIVADSDNAFTDHGEAFRLFKDIADRLAGIDPEEDPRAPYVASAFHSVAMYLARGASSAGLKQQPRLARAYLEHSAVMFADQVAQFELAKMLLHGEGGPADVERAVQFFATLSREGHAGAQALYGEILWRGRYAAPDKKRALVWAELAVKGASGRDHLWIDQIYQEIYCGSGTEGRMAAGPLVQKWERLFREPKRLRDARSDGLALQRTCEDGRPVPLLQALRGPPAAAPPKPVGAQVLPQAAPSAPPADGFREVSRPGE